MAYLNDVSIIIPVGENDDSWKNLLPDLLLLPMDTEIIFVGTQVSSEMTKNISEKLELGRTVKFVQAQSGRGKMLNAGANAATKSFLWFLHSDSRLSHTTLSSLEQSLKVRPESVLYFDLKFSSDGPKLMPLNEVGVWVRAHVLTMPFGDQGFCVATWLFQKLGKFSENASYGEDHLFIWAARHAGISIRCTGGSLFTSARKYANRGWMKTTLNHQYLTYKQAIPEYSKFLKNRFMNVAKVFRS